MKSGCEIHSPVLLNALDRLHILNIWPRMICNNDFLIDWLLVDMYFVYGRLLLCVYWVVWFIILWFCVALIVWFTCIFIFFLYFYSYRFLPVVLLFYGSQFSGCVECAFLVTWWNKYDVGLAYKGCSLPCQRSNIRIVPHCQTDLGETNVKWWLA